MSSASDLIPSYSFDVRMNGLSFSFARVSNLSGTIAIDTIIDGGSNDSPVILRVPKKTPDMLILEKGLYTTFGDMSFALFTEGSSVGSININVFICYFSLKIFSGSWLSLELMLDTSLHQRCLSRWLREAISSCPQWR